VASSVRDLWSTSSHFFVFVLLISTEECVYVSNEEDGQSQCIVVESVVTVYSSGSFDSYDQVLQRAIDRYVFDISGLLSVTGITVDFVGEESGVQPVLPRDNNNNDDGPKVSAVTGATSTVTGPSSGSKVGIAIAIGALATVLGLVFLVRRDGRHTTGTKPRAMIASEDSLDDTIDDMSVGTNLCPIYMKGGRSDYCEVTDGIEVEPMRTNRKQRIRYVINCQQLPDEELEETSSTQKGLFGPAPTLQEKPPEFPEDEDRNYCFADTCCL
jgi:hypothetical protein